MRRLIAMACVLAACSPAPDADKAEPLLVAESVPVTSPGTVRTPTAPWTCADGQGFAITVYGEPDHVELVFPDGARLTLPQVVAASGALYEDAGHSFHSRGREALFIQNGKTTICHAIEGSN